MSLYAFSGDLRYQLKHASPRLVRRIPRSLPHDFYNAAFVEILPIVGLQAPVSFPHREQDGKMTRIRCCM